MCAMTSDCLAEHGGPLFGVLQSGKSPSAGGRYLFVMPNHLIVSIIFLMSGKW